MNKPEIIIHIGTNKTGTSFIQSVLNSQHDTLEKAGLLYPRTGCHGDAHYDFSRTLDFFSVKPLFPTMDSEPVIKMAASLSREIKRKSPQTVLISSEYFMLPRNGEIVRQFFEGYSCKILVYLRRHDKWWESAYAQAVKTVVHPQWGMGFDAYKAWQAKHYPHWGNYRGLLNRWEKYFGAENIIVRPYERQQNQPTLVHDFLNAIGFSDLAGKLDIPDVQVNPSPSRLAIQLVDLYQRLDISDRLREKLIKSALKMPVDGQEGGLVSPAMKYKLVAENHDVYNYIARKYLGRKDGVLFMDPPPDAEAPWNNTEVPPLVEAVETTIKLMKPWFFQSTRFTQE